MTPSSRILVVDDDRSQMAVFKDCLLSHGYEVAAAASAREALDLLGPTLAQTPSQPPHPDQFDLVILDLLMPETDGTEVLRHIRKKRPSHVLPVIIATAKDDPEDIVDGLHAGANDYITKPINLEVLLARVDTQLSLRRAHRGLRHAQQSLIHAARMESVGYLAAGVAQEFLVPFARIESGLALLQGSRAIADDKTLSEALQSTMASVQQTNRVIKNLASFSSEDLLDLQPRDAQLVVEQAIELLQTELADADIYVETDFDSTLPAALFATEELRRVLVIVLLNAIEAMPDLGSITVRTNVQVAEESSLANLSNPGTGIARGDQVVCIEVLDSGVGLAGSDPLVPFNAFYTTKNSPASPGLGLTIAKKLMDLQGGLIKIANRDDKQGACLTLSLRPAAFSPTRPQSATGRLETVAHPATP